MQVDCFSGRNIRAISYTLPPCNRIRHRNNLNVQHRRIVIENEFIALGERPEFLTKHYGK